MSIVWNHQSLIKLQYSYNPKGNPDRYIDLMGNRLVLKVTARSKTWVWQANVRGTPRTLTLGKFPHMRLEKARAEAARLLAGLQAGEDVHTAHTLARLARGSKALAMANTAPGQPPAPSQVGSGSMTCQQAWDAYIGALAAGTNLRGRKAANKPRTIIEKKGTWERNFRDAIGSMALGDVTEDDLLEVVELQRDDGHPGAADSSIRYIRAFFNWCVGERRKTKLVDSPARNMRPGKLAPRERTLLEDELRWLWAALDVKHDDGNFVLHPLWRAAYRLAILTGQRRLEIFGLERAEVDEYRKQLLIPARRMKTLKDHIVPIGPMAWRLIQERKQATNDPYLFPSFITGKKPRPVSGFSRIQQRVRALVEAEAAKEQRTVDHWLFHDIRRTFSTLANGITGTDGKRAIPKDHIERTMSHLIQGVEGVYDRNDYLDEKRRVLHLWEDEVIRIVKYDDSV